MLEVNLSGNLESASVSFKSTDFFGSVEKSTVCAKPVTKFLGQMCPRFACRLAAVLRMMRCWGKPSRVGELPFLLKHNPLVRGRGKGEGKDEGERH